MKVIEHFFRWKMAQYNTYSMIDDQLRQMQESVNEIQKNVHNNKISLGILFSGPFFAIATHSLLDAYINKNSYTSRSILSYWKEVTLMSMSAYLFYTVAKN